MSERDISVGRMGNGSQIGDEDIPNDWDINKISEVAEVNSNPKSNETDVPYLPMDSLDRVLPSPRYVEYRNPEKNSGTMFQQGDTLFAKITPSTENGKSAYVDQIDTSVGIATTEVITLSPKSVNPLYLYYYSNCHPSKEYAVSRMRGTSGRQRVPKSVFERELNIPSPSMEEQERIASILYSVDQHISTLDKRYTNLTTHKQALMQDLLTGNKRVTPQESVTSRVLNDKEAAEISTNEEWETQRLDEAYLFKDTDREPLNQSERDEKTDGETGEIPYYGANGVVDYIDEYLFDDELILVAEDGGHFKEYHTRPIAYMIQGKSWVNNHAHVMVTKDHINNWYGLYALEHKNLVPYITGSTRAKLTKGNFKLASIDVPPLWEQERIASVLYTVDEMIARTDTLKQEYEQLKRGLMQDLLSGDVRTPDRATVLDSVRSDTKQRGK